MHKHGGKYLARILNMAQLEGQQDAPNVFVIIEWPSKEAAKNFYDDPEYQPHLQKWVAGSDCEFTLVAGEEMAEF